MAGFWFMNANARERIADCLKSEPEGRIISEETFVFLKDAARRVPKLLSGENVRLPEQGVIERSRPEQAAAAGGLR